LGLIWQVVKAGLLSQVNLREHPELVVILDERENVESFSRLTPEANLLRWFNFHLQQAQHHRRVNDFSNDVRVRVVSVGLINVCRTPKTT
jgi:plastin-1